MALPHKRWQIHPLLPPAAEDALAPIGPPILRQVLYNRGYTDARQARAFLAGASLESTDPLRLRGMAAAVARLGAALDRGERIVVYGDYDTDGVTATALLVQTLGALGGVVEPYIPNRFDEGYGLNTEALGTLAEGGPGLVVTVDCGIRSPAEALFAREHGLDLIITDHHHPGPVLPAALALINPRQPGDGYPYKDLAGVGLAYKLAQALVSARGADFPTDSLLDLVALGTVADLAPLTGENRALVRAGLALLNRPERPGVRSLLGVSRVAPGQVSATTVGFSLGPRLNAAGRLDSALAAYELLTTRDAARLAPLAAQLEAQNRERQELTRSMHQQARELALDGQGEPLLLFAAHETFNRGVVGLAASRLVDEFYRPALVAERGPQETRGSARSIPEFHITAALDECTDLLERHGGHAAAAGFTVRNENLAPLAERLQQIARRELAALDLRPSLRIDAVVRISSLDWALLEHLRQLEPCGMGNPSPVLAVRDARVTSYRAVGKTADHLKLTLSDGRLSVDAIAFGMGAWAGRMPPRVDLAFNLEVNEWAGQRNLQLNVRDLKRAGTPDG